jgi:hypothetical protein
MMAAIESEYDMVPLREPLRNCPQSHHIYFIYLKVLADRWIEDT